jgi:hypothetical protein
MQAKLELPKFDGRRSIEDWKRQLVCSFRAMKMLTGTEEDDKNCLNWALTTCDANVLKYLDSHVMGIEQKMLEHETHRQRLIHDGAEERTLPRKSRMDFLCDILQARYGNIMDSMDLRRRLTSMRFTRERALDFVNNYTDICLQLGNSMTETDKVFHFGNALPNDLRLRFFEQRIDTSERAISFVKIHCEARGYTPIHSEDRLDPVPMDLGHVRQSTGKVCFGCGKTGHVIG